MLKGENNLIPVLLLVLVSIIALAWVADKLG